MLRERRRHANFKPNRKLDRKSSHGMIYENEELRLRTININAEVERGQSDIKKLRRENYQLRREIWTLRDEYDRLGKLMKTNSRSNDNNINNTHDCSSSTGDCKNICEYDDACRCCSCLLDDDTVSCDMCNENENCAKDFEKQTLTKSMNCEKVNYGGFGGASSIRNDKMNMSFDHLSVVSEECLSNSDDQTNQKVNSKSDNEMGTAQQNGDTKEAIYSNFQSTIPPLKHFENLSYKDIGPNIGEMGYEP